MNEPSKSHDGYTVLPAGELETGEHFYLKRNGRAYTCHDKVISNREEGGLYRQFYVVAVHNCKQYLIDYDQKVLACR